MKIASRWDASAEVVLYQGETLELLRAMPNACAQLVVTSPPYNIAKAYEPGRVDLDKYVEAQQGVVDECVRVLRVGGSICWEVGNHVGQDEITPLDLLLYPVFHRHAALKLRNRIVWHFEHGLHCKNRFSGRHEVVLWFTKGSSYHFNLDPVRVPQKYPGKRAWKGPRAGQYTGHPKGKIPVTYWIFPNVKANHVEKTTHPCQFPVELVERLLLALTSPGDLVVDPYIGVGTTACAALLHGRRVAGADIMAEYITIARERVTLAAKGQLKTRPMGRPVHRPDPTSALARRDGLDSPPAAPRSRRQPAQGLRIARRALGDDSSTPQRPPLNDLSDKQLALASLFPRREPKRVQISEIPLGTAVAIDDPRRIVCASRSRQSLSHTRTS